MWQCQLLLLQGRLGGGIFEFGSIRFEVSECKTKEVGLDCLIEFISQ